MTIYKITNLVNGKIYIGKTISPLNKVAFERPDETFWLGRTINIESDERIK